MIGSGNEMSRMLALAVKKVRLSLQTVFHISQLLICAEMSGSTWYNADPP
jgi:hypothetical protein